MSDASRRHHWGTAYEFRGTTYRECADPGCRCHQHWICALDRWSDAFDGPSPRAREATPANDPEATSARWRR